MTDAAMPTTPGTLTNSAIEQLTTLLKKLEAIKIDKTTYIKSPAVVELYNEFAGIIRPLVKLDKDVIETGEGESVGGCICGYLLCRI